jgi:phosphatidylserine decarboxylase
MLDTRYGQAFFSNPKVNEHLGKIFDAYNTMLKSVVSLKYLNEEEPNGWFCPTAQKHCDWDDYFVDREKPHWGFQSWNEWFSRPIRPERRPIAEGKNVIVQSSDSTPLFYPEGSKGKNPCFKLKGEDKFWLKDNRYSLYDMFDARSKNLKKFIDDHFVNGALYQAFLDPWCYHRWHAPITGTIFRSYRLGGTYFLDSPGMEQIGINRGTNNFIGSQPLMSIVSVRHIYIIKLDDSDRYVSVIEIGMGEVSSCHSTVIEGQHVEKGDQLGFFEFGGSSHVVIFDKALELEFNPEIFKKNENGVYPKQLVNAKLATYK